VRKPRAAAEEKSEVYVPNGASSAFNDHCRSVRTRSLSRPQPAGLLAQGIAEFARGRGPGGGGQ